MSYRAAPLALGLLLATLVACGGSSTGPTPTPTSVAVSVASGDCTNPFGGCQLAARASFSDGSSQDVASSATWTSSNTSVASVTATGKLVIYARSQTNPAGATTVTARFGGAFGSRPFTN